VRKLPLLLACACVGELPSGGHVLVHVTTDAPLPRSSTGCAST
jgi:hypothetical protein